VSWNSINSKALPSRTVQIGDFRRELRANGAAFQVEFIAHDDTVTAAACHPVD
jgi:hypothetical protein